MAHCTAVAAPCEYRRRFYHPDDRTAIWANPKYRTMLGLAEDVDLVGRPITEHVAPETASMVEDRACRRSRGEDVPGAVLGGAQSPRGGETP